MRLKKKLFIVGAFPQKTKTTIYGGQITACRSLINSQYLKDFQTLTLDSTSISNPPPKFIIRLFFATKRFLNYIFKLTIIKPDVVLLFTADKSSAVEKGLMILISKILKIPVMIFPRAGALKDQYFKNKLFNLYLNFTFSKADLFLCQGRSFQNFAIEEFNFTTKTAPIIPNWTSNRKHLEIGKSRIINIKNNLNNILFMGWLEEFKGVKEILEAIKLLKEKNYQFHLYLAGDGKAMDFCQNFIKNNNLQTYVTLLGWINEEEKIELLSKTNIFLLPSWSEGLPNAMIEAMSAGLSCIVSNVGMIPDYAYNEENSLLINPKRTNEIIISLEKLFKDDVLQKRLSKNAYLFAVDNFTQHNGLKLLSKEIKNLIKITQT